MTDNETTARQELAARLSRLRESADDGRPLTFRQLAERAHFGAATLNKAATGREVPTWPVVRAFVSACGDDPEAYRELWERAKSASPASIEPLPAGHSLATVEEHSTASDPASERDDKSIDSVPRNRRGPSTRALLWGAAGALLIVATTAVVLVATIRPSAPSAPTPAASPTTVTAPTTPPAAPALGPTRAEISSPPGPTVGFRFTVAGTLSGAPPTATVWEANLEMDNNRLYPLNRPCLLINSDQFNCGDAFVGQQVMAPGNEYTVLVLDASPEAVNAFHQYNALKKTPAGRSVHGLLALPPGARVIGQKVVTRS